MATKPAKPKSQRAKTAAEIEAEKKRLAEARSAAARKAAARAAREDECDTDEDADGDAKRDEDQDEERDGDQADQDEDGGSDGERDGGDDAEDDEDRDGDDEEDGDDEGERAAPVRAKRKALTPAEVRKAAQEAVRADRVRGAKIREIAAQFGLPKLGERHANGETSVRAFKDIVLERLASRQAKRGTTTFAAAATAGVGESYGGGAPSARDHDKGAAEARALLGKK